MAKLMKMLQPLQSEYVDRRFDGTKDEYFKQLELSSTLYIGNLSFYTTEDQIYELFGKVGVVRRVIMGLDRHSKTPCGFCFVIYHTRKDAHAAVKYLNGTKLDNRQLRVDIDYGFEEGRQYGRGRSGGQVRDEFRTDYDADRGGYGRVVAQQLAAQQLAMWQEVQAGAVLGAGVLPGAGAGGAVFFGQDQRRHLGQHAAEGREEGGDEQAAAAEPLNPRMAGRGQDRDEDDDEQQEQEQEEEDQEQHRAKRRRVGSLGGVAAAADEAAGAASEGVDGDGADAEDDLVQDALADAAAGDAGEEDGAEEQQQEEQEDEDIDYVED